MAYDKFLIAPFNSGLQTDLRPFLVMDDAFTYLQNAYVFRGRLRKRFGSLLMGASPINSRFRASLVSGGASVGITSNVGAATGNVNSITGFPVASFAVGQSFSIGTQIYTIISATAGVQAMLATSGSGTFNISTGAYTFTGAPALTTIFFYPGLPVMGLTQYESGAINNHPSYGFDTRFAYTFTGGAWARSGTAIWKGTNLNYFWATNWEGSVTAASSPPIMFVTNFNATVGPSPQPSATDDPIWYFDGTTWYSLPGTLASTRGFFFLPSYGGSPQAAYTGPFVQTALIIVAFKDRLLLLNTIENDNSTTNAGSGITTQYKNRCRYSFNGSPLARNAWYEPNTSDTGVGATLNNNIAAGAGYIDATTEEGIISAEFIKDRLIVYFERSTWELVYTGNEILPFLWQKINTELGSQGTFSTVAFDKDVLTIGNTGVHACSGANVIRVDTKIPQKIFDSFETKNSAPARIAGIRDYFTELVYWSYLDTSAVNQNFPNQLLVFNYQNGSWAVNDDCFTAFGYFEQQTDLTWASSSPLTWQQFNASWIDNIIQANQRQIIAGTPEGFVLRIASDISRNAPSMQITNMTIPSTVYGAGYVDLQVINHNVAVDDFVAIENAVGLNLPILGFYQVFNVIDANNFTLYAPDISGTYLGGGTLARVSNIQFNTKQINPYNKDDQNLFLQRVDFLVEKTSSGQITVDYYPSATELSMISSGEATGTIMGTGILETFPADPLIYPLENEQERLTHSVFFQTTGNCIQLACYLTPAQLSNGQIAWSDFQLDGLILVTCRAGRFQ